MAFTGKNIVPIVDGGAGLGSATKGWGGAFITNVTASSATEGGKLVLAANDGAVMASGHRLGVIEFKGAEDTASTLTIGARIEALCDATWSDEENGASLKMYTTDANASESLVLTLDSDKLATFTGAVTVTGALTGTLATASQPNVTTLAGLTSFGSAGATTNILAGDLTMYNPVDGGDPTISIGSSTAERLLIKADYTAGGQILYAMNFATYTASTSADYGKYRFFVDQNEILNIDDGGIDFKANKGISIAGTNILTDSGGTATLSNIDAGSITLNGLTIDPADGNTTPTLDSRTLHIDTCTYTDTTTGEGATSAADFATVSMEGSTLAASIASTTTNAATLYIKDAVTAGTNKTITNPYALWVDAGNARFDGDIDVDGTLETDALTIAGATIAAIGTEAITTLGTIGTGVWQGTAVASAYLDADTMHYSAQRQMTHHTIKDDIGTGVIYISLQESDAETGTISNKQLPLLAPVAGKLLKVFLRTTSDMSGSGHDTNLTWRLLTRAASATTGGNAAVIGTKVAAGPTDSSMVAYDFTDLTTSGASGTNAIVAGDKVQLSVQSDASSEDQSFLITCLWEWDLS